MTNSSYPGKPSSKGYFIWLVGVSFLLFQFFLQLSSGVILGKIMEDMKYSALVIGTLSSAFYYVYTGLQIPVGLLFDRFNTRHLMAFNAAICSLGCLLFAISTQYQGLFLGRILIGAGSAFAFVGISHLLREHFPLNQFAFMIGLSDTLGFLVTVAGMIAMGYLISQWGWRGFMFGAALVGFLISFLCWYYIPSSKHARGSENNDFKKLVSILANPLTWINGLFSGLGFTVITVFGALWAVPFLQLKLQISLFHASIVGSMIFFGAALGFPLFGKLSASLKKRKPLMHASCLSTAAFLLLIIFLPAQSHVLIHSLVMFCIGLFCGAYILAFAIANELATKDARSTCTGFTNTLAMITAPLLQPLIGYLIDWMTLNTGINSLLAYQLALLVIPFCLLLASFLVCFLPEKKSSVNTR